MSPKHSEKANMKLILLRTEANWTMDELAEKAGIDKTTLRYIENGTTRTPIPVVQKAICDALSTKLNRVIKPEKVFKKQGVRHGN